MASSAAWPGRRLVALGTRHHVVEVGCGEGAQLTALALRLALTPFTGIDITPAAGPLGCASDRFITGDRIRYRTRSDGRARMAGHPPGWTLESERSLRPWASNHAFVPRAPASAAA